MAKYYIYYSESTRSKYCTVYEWHSKDNTTKLHCRHQNNNIFKSKHIEIDFNQLLLVNNNSGETFKLVDPLKDINNLRYESESLGIQDYAEAF